MSGAAADPAGAVPGDGHPSVADLRRIDLFTELDDQRLAAWAAAALLRRARAGETISEQGQRMDGLTLLLDGTIDMLLTDRGPAEPAGQQLAPTWIGAIPTLTRSGSPIAMRARTDIRYALVPADALTDLVLADRTVFQRVMSQVRPVIGRYAQREAQRERLESLGTMAAGLAHELNNPAAAVRSTASELGKALDTLEASAGELLAAGLGAEQGARLVELRGQALARARAVGAGGTGAGAGEARSALDQADAEDELAAVLEDAGVPGAYELSEPLAAAGLDGEFVEQVIAAGGDAAPAALHWIATSLSAGTQADELAHAAEQMTRLVKAIKAYAYMDRGEVVQVDVREGLETTLTILGHKLKHRQIEIQRDYDPALGPLTVRGAELNQVWTNLLDNAIDALGDRGRIKITTRSDGDCAEVDIADDGPGIPAEIRDRVFDPFFTTKEVGQGSGLGLDTARRIIVDRHHGSLTLASEPGQTVLRVRLPVNAVGR